MLPITSLCVCHFSPTVRKLYWKKKKLLLLHLATLIFSAHEWFSLQHIYTYWTTTALRRSTRSSPASPSHGANVSARVCSIRGSLCPAFKTSFILPEKKVRHVLVNHEGDATRWGDADQVGDDAFVETKGTFIPEETSGKMLSINHTRHSNCAQNLRRGRHARSHCEWIGVLPPCPSHDVNNSIVSIVLVLQASSHHLIWVCCGHGKYFG